MEDRIAYQPQPLDEYLQRQLLLGPESFTKLPEGKTREESLADNRHFIAKHVEEPNWTDNLVVAQACLALLEDAILLGQKPGDEDYEQAITWLTEIINASGRFAERPGPVLEWDTINAALVRAAYRSSLVGDNRLKDQTYFAFLPLWYMHHLQPGGDNGPNETLLALINNSLIDQSLLYPSADIKWWLETIPEEPVNSALIPPALAAVEIPEDFTPPPPFAVYPRAAVLFWRSSWAPGADGLVVYGALDGNLSTFERAGQVEWIAHGDPVLIQADQASEVVAIDAKPNADGELTTQLIPRYSTMLIGESTPQPGRAPIIARDLNALGGNLRVDGSAIYPELSLWHRDLFWEAGGELRIIDTVRYDFGQRDRTSFYWHLSATEPVTIETDRSRSIVEWGENAIVFQGNSLLDVEQFLVPNSEAGDGVHVVIRLRTIGRPHSLRLLTRVLPREAPEEVAETDSGSPEPAVD